MGKNLKILERIYFGLLVVLYLLIIFTPLFIKSGISFIREEFIEASIISLLIIISYYVLILYRKEVAKNLKKLKELEHKKENLEERLTEAFKYIGAINVQINEIRSAFAALSKYPESKKDYKYIMQFFGQKILGMVNADWVLLKIVDVSDYKTLREHVEVRGGAALLKYSFTNKDLVDGEVPDCYSIVRSSQENFTIKTICLLPIKRIDKEPKVMIQAIVNQLEMLFLIFASQYYKNMKN